MISDRWAVLVLIALLAGCTAACVGSGSDRPPAIRPTASASISSVTRPSTARPITPTSTAVAPLSAKARVAGLVDVRTIVPDAIIDLRYATTDNFVGIRLYPVDARCLVHRTMAAGLTAAAARLRREGDVLVFWDCYRPHAVQVHMFQVVPNPQWVARPGPSATSHEAARSVDVSVAAAVLSTDCPLSRRVQRHCLLDMGTDFDDFTPRAYAYATQGISALQYSNRSRLRDAMRSGGLDVYSGEWWHFDGPGARVARPYLDVPVN
jgi:D-alanyl-D-alanine dipeptidase